MSWRAGSDNMPWNIGTFADELLRHQVVMQRCLCIFQINGRKMAFSFFWLSFYHPGGRRKRSSHCSSYLHYTISLVMKKMHSSFHILEWKIHIKIKSG